MVRPCKVDTVQFRRRLNDQERAILLAAGAGCLTRGFRNMLDVYAALHNLGYRPDSNILGWIVTKNTGQ